MIHTLLYFKVTHENNDVWRVSSWVRQRCWYACVLRNERCKSTKFIGRIVLAFCFFWNMKIACLIWPNKWYVPLSLFYRWPVACTVCFIVAFYKMMRLSSLRCLIQSYQNMYSVCCYLFLSFFAYSPWFIVSFCFALNFCFLFYLNNYLIWNLPQFATRMTMPSTHCCLRHVRVWSCVGVYLRFVFAFLLTIVCNVCVSNMLWWKQEGFREQRNKQNVHWQTNYCVFVWRWWWCL